MNKNKTTKSAEYRHTKFSKVSTLKYFYFVFAAIIAMIGYSCGSDSVSGTEEPNPQEPDPGPVTSQLCDGINVEFDSAEPLDLVTISGIHPEFGDEPVGWLTHNGNESVFLLFPDENEGSFTVIVPPHPTNWIEGGEAVLSLSDAEDTVECTGFNVTIEPLERSPGEIERYISVYKTGINQIISDFGFDAAELMDRPVTELAPEVMPFVAALHLLESNRFENNLSSLLDGSAPFLEGEPVSADVIELYEAVLAKANLVESMEIFFDGMLNITEKISVQKKRASKQLLHQNADFQVTPFQLSLLMEAQEFLEEQLQGTSGNIRNGSQAALGMISAALGIVAPITGGATGAVALGTSVAGTALGIANLMIEGAAALLPSELDLFETNVQPMEFEEDSDDWAIWVTDMVVKSKGYTLTIAKLAGLVPLGNKKLNQLLGEVSSNLVQFLATFTVNIWGVQGEAGESFGPNTWGVLVLPDEHEDFFSWELIYISSWDDTTPAFLFDASDEQFILPNTEGVSELRVRPKEGAFPFPTAPVSSQEIRVNPITIQLNPTRVTLSLKDSEPEDFNVRFTADVDNAIDKTLEWIEDNGRGFFQIEDDVANTVTYNVPQEEGTYLITTEAVTENGTRSDGLPPRTQTAGIRVVEDVELIIIPGGACLDPGSSITFEAEVIGVDEEPDIQWSASAGSFSGNVYTAPASAAGVVTITAEDTELELFDSITIKVGGCVCQWNATFSGDLGGTANGTYAVYEDFFTGPPNFTNFRFWPELKDNIPGFSMTELSIVGNRDTGSRSVSVIFVDTNNDFNWGAPVEPFAGLPVHTIEVNTGSLISGIVSGNLAKIVPKGEFEEPDIFTAGFTLEYTARKKTAGNPNPCE